MAKIRVYELAKQLSVSSKELMDVLKEIGADIRSHQSGIDDSIARKAVSLIMKRVVKGEDVVQKSSTSKSIESVAMSSSSTKDQDDTAKVEQAFKKVEPVQNKVEQASKKVEPVQNKIEQISKKVEPVQNKVEQAPKKVEPVQNKVEQASKKVESVQNKVEQASKKVESVQNKVEQEPQKIEPIQNKVEQTPKKVEPVQKTDVKNIKLEQNQVKENKQASLKPVEKVDVVKKEMLKDKQFNDEIESKKLSNSVKKDGFGNQQKQNKEGQNKNNFQRKDNKDGFGNQQGQNRDGQNRSFRKDKDVKDGAGNQQGQNRDGQNRNFQRRDGKDGFGSQQGQSRENKDGQNRNFRRDRDGKDGFGSQQGQNRDGQNRNFQRRDGKDGFGNQQGQNRDGQNRNFQRRDGKDGFGNQQGQNRDGQNRNFQCRDGKDGFANKQGQNRDGQNRGLGGMKFDASMFQDKDKPERPAKSSSRNQQSKKNNNYGMDMSLLGKASQVNQKQQRQRIDKKDKDLEELESKKAITKPIKKATPKKNVVKQVVEEVKPEIFEIAFPITIGELAPILSLKTSDILMKLLQNGRMLAVNHSLDKDLIFSILDLFEIPHEKVEFKEDVVSEEDEEDDPRFMIARPPVVTILGHVDHGKTSLLDAIRKSNVTAGEAGGITQKIGAYVVEHDSKKIVFLDTPGHEAFTAMRARGAQVTDIAVLVVAADDGVMPQTIEAINHAKAAKVPIIVAINKIDKPGSNPERVKQQLSEHGLIPEDWGGDVICVPVSAKAKMGIDDLLEMITLVADIQELKANPRRRAYGVILESRLDKGLGCMATVLVQKGTLKPGDSVIAGLTSGKVRVLINEKGERVKKATPSIPVEIVGLTDLPNAGDILRVVKDDKMARQISDERQTRDRERHLVSGPRTTLQDIFKTMSEGEKKQLDVLIKADSNGSVEAIKHSLAKLPDDEVKVNVIHGAVGAVSESDVLLARASNSLIIGFNIKMEANIKKLADQEKVAIRNYDVIYRMIEDIQAAMKGMLEPEYESVLTGTAEVRQLFKASKVGVIAGSYVSSGKVMRNSDLKIYRNKKLIHEGKIESLKRFKDDVREVIEGFECGITVENFNDIQVGDTIEAYIMKEKVR